MLHENEWLFAREGVAERRYWCTPLCHDRGWKWFLAAYGSFLHDIPERLSAVRMSLSALNVYPLDKTVEPLISSIDLAPAQAPSLRQLQHLSIERSVTSLQA
jgi:hypothetical protein